MRGEGEEYRLLNYISIVILIVLLFETKTSLTAGVLNEVKTK